MVPVSVPVVTYARALRTVEATEPGELAFERFGVIRVVDRAYGPWNGGANSRVDAPAFFV